MEDMEMKNNNNFWNNRKVFVTGHTGFKGSWLCLWLHTHGAKVTGYALDPPTKPSMFKLCRVNEVVDSVVADIRDRDRLLKAMSSAAPEIVIHMAAQSLVRVSYKDPVETYTTNVIGVVNLFESVRKCNSVRSVVNVTTDKCYENKEWNWGYREKDPMGGYDPYSSSKGCSELITASYRNSFFNPNQYFAHKVAVASARAGNVIGGGDWAYDRLIPDCINSLLRGEEIIIRNPGAIRPWQHVLEPLYGYMMLAQSLYEKGAEFAEAWNFGPDDNDAKTVEWVVDKLCKKWGNGASYKVDTGEHPHEAQHLKLDCSKAKSRLNWYPRWDLDQALDSVVEWMGVYNSKQDLRDICYKQIDSYLKNT